MITKDLEAKALDLSATEKIHLVEILLESLDKPDKVITKEWVKESDKRYKAMKDGKVKPISYDDVLKRFKK